MTQVLQSEKRGYRHTTNTVFLDIKSRPQQKAYEFQRRARGKVTGFFFQFGVHFALSLSLSLSLFPPRFSLFGGTRVLNLSKLGLNLDNFFFFEKRFV